MTRFSTRRMNGHTEYKCDQCQQWSAHGSIKPGRDHEGDTFNCFKCYWGTESPIMEGTSMEDTIDTKTDTDAMTLELTEEDILILDSIVNKARLYSEDIWVMREPNVSNKADYKDIEKLRDTKIGPFAQAIRVANKHRSMNRVTIP